jgi:hypothetical protein
MGFRPEAGQEIHGRLDRRRRPSRRPLCGLLRMTAFSMPSKPYRHPEERPTGASRRTQHPYAALRPNSCPASPRIPPRLAAGSALRIRGAAQFAWRSRPTAHDASADPQSSRREWVLLPLSGRSSDGICRSAGGMPALSRLRLSRAGHLGSIGICRSAASLSKRI